MPPQKRPRKINDIVSLLQTLQTVVSKYDYDMIRDLLSLYDNVETRIAREQKRIMSKGTLYSNACHSIFAQLCQSSLVANHFLLIMQRIDELTETSRNSSTEALYNEAIASIRAKKGQDRCAQKEAIIHECSHLQISLRIKTISMAIHFNADVDGVGPDRCSLLENVIPEYILQSKLFCTLRNYCMLGAVVRYTENQKKRMKECLMNVRFPVYNKPILDCGDLERAEVAILAMIERNKKSKSVRRHNTKLQKEAIKVLQSDFLILEIEASNAKTKLEKVKSDNLRCEHIDEIII